MTHEAEQDRMAAHRREWDKQSIYLRLQEGIPAAFWVWGDLVAPLEPCLTQGDQGASFGWGEAGEASLALSHAIIARLVSVGLVAPEQAGGEGPLPARRGAGQAACRRALRSAPELPAAAAGRSPRICGLIPGWPVPAGLIAPRFYP
ncbi:hypothetical protein [Aeromonas caviae]|uniref:hypothetical protein n=1 Tax=Aeromonas caviae TaxID=648 RepID=UPI0038D0CA63